VTFQEIMRQYRHQPQAKSHVRTKIQGSHCVPCATVCWYCMQVYRSVLLNSGPHKAPQPDSPSELTLGKTSEGASPVALQGKETPVDHILYRADIPVGSRGDIIQFYNKLFIGFIKDYVLRFSPNDAEVGSLVGHGRHNQALCSRFASQLWEKARRQHWDDFAHDTLSL